MHCSDSDALKELLNTGTYKGIKCSGAKPSMDYKGALINGLKSAIETRMLDPQEEAGVVEATGVANIKLWPVEEQALEGGIVTQTTVLTVCHAIFCCFIFILLKYRMTRLIL